MTEILHAGLMNDSVPESFPTKNQADDGTVTSYLLVLFVVEAQHWFDTRSSLANTSKSSQFFLTPRSTIRASGISSFGA